MRNKLLFVLLILISFGSLVQAQNVIFQDDFSDGDITDWNQAMGTWNANNFDLNGGRSDPSYISHPAIMPALAQYDISYDVKLQGLVATNAQFFWFTNDTNVTTINSYELLTSTSSTLVRKRVAGVPTNLITGPGLSQGIYHSINIVHNGPNITVLVDGALLGTVSDSTYSSGTVVAFGTDNSPDYSLFDNILITSTGTSNVIVTVMRPIDEKTFQTIQKPWSVTVSGGVSSFLDSNSNTKAFLVPKDINMVTNFLVDDSNATANEYFARNYVVYFTLNDSNFYTIQPYLIDIDDVGILINLQVLDAGTNITLPNIRTTISGGVAGVNVILEDRVTDATGTSQVVLLSQKQYDLNITSIDQNVGYYTNQLISAVSASIRFFINFSDTNSSFVPQNVQYSISPTTNTVSGVTQKFDVNIGTSFPVINFIVQAVDNNRVVASNTSSSNPFNTSLTVTLADFNSSTVIIRTIIQGLDQNTIKNNTYIITSIGSGGLLNLINLRQNLSPTNVLIVAVLFLIGLVIVFGSSPSGNNDAQVFGIALGMGLLAFLLFREFFLYVIGAVFAGGIAWLWTRSNR